LEEGRGGKRGEEKTEDKKKDETECREGEGKESHSFPLEVEILATPLFNIPYVNPLERRSVPRRII